MKALWGWKIGRVVNWGLMFMILWGGCFSLLIGTSDWGDGQEPPISGYEALGVVFTMLLVLGFCALVDRLLVKRIRRYDPDYGRLRRPATDRLTTASEATDQDESDAGGSSGDQSLEG